jgi:hypothetical protein
MSTSSITTTATEDTAPASVAPRRRRMGRKARIGLIGVSAASAAVLAAQPAMAGVSSYYLHAAPDYSYAEIYVNGGTQGRAIAQHGSLVAVSNWYTYNAWAYADSGTSNSYYAAVQWRY